MNYLLTGRCRMAPSPFTQGAVCIFRWSISIVTKVLMRIASLKAFLVQWKNCVGTSSMRKTKLMDVLKCCGTDPNKVWTYLTGWDTNLWWKYEHNFDGHMEDMKWHTLDVFFNIWMVLMIENLAIKWLRNNSESMCLMSSFPTRVGWVHWLVSWGIAMHHVHQPWDVWFCMVSFLFPDQRWSKSKIKRGITLGASFAIWVFPKIGLPKMDGL